MQPGGSGRIWEAGGTVTLKGIRYGEDPAVGTVPVDALGPLYGAPQAALSLMLRVGSEALLTTVSHLFEEF